MPAFVIALTGGIASGKTAVSDTFSDLGVAVIDTDVIAREVVLPDSAGLVAIADSFGNQLIQDDGQLNRRALRDIIFADKSKRELLESILHPLIRAESIRQLQQVDTPLAILVIPLLAEGLDSGNTYQWVDRVLVVDVDEAIQIQRLTARDQVSEPLAQAILDNQASRKQRLAIADDVIVNDRDLEYLRVAVGVLYNEYLGMVRS
ncbi:MAG: dephospho-CoA kinase [Proteobacteria bacterium]|nr:dephospho-CoA kinase [Pseudomonadota bacterium]